MTETNNDGEREVNAVEDIDDTPADVEETDADDEDVVPADLIPGEGEDADEPKESEEDGSPDSSPEETVDDVVEETKSDTEPSNENKKPAPVEGETPREKALRLEVQRLKKERREKEISDLADPRKSVPHEKTEDDLKEIKDLGYSEEEASTLEKVIDVIAKKKGYVKASDNYQSAVNDTVNGFINAHPEYKPENDPEDVRWNRFNEVLKSGLYNITGKSPKDLEKIFNKVHGDVIEELGEPTVSVETKRTAAARQKINSVSHSGGTKSTPTKQDKKTIAPEVRGMFKGFEDEDLE